jgi:hypothetical protein
MSASAAYVPASGGEPESNGMNLVKTLKRDFLRVIPVPDAASVLDRIAGWLVDYNDNHPHSGLRMRSPRAFRCVRQPAEVSGYRDNITAPADLS